MLRGEGKTGIVHTFRQGRMLNSASLTLDSRRGWIIRWWEIDEGGAVKCRQETLKDSDGSKVKPSDIRRASRILAVKQEELDKRVGLERFGWETFCREYEEARISGLGDATIRHWHSVRGKIMDFDTDLLYLSEINEEWLDKFSSWMLRHGKLPHKSDPQKRRRPMSASSVSSYFKRLRDALGWAEDRGFLARRPKIPVPQQRKSKDSRGRPLERDEVLLLLVSMDRIYPTRTARSLKRLCRGMLYSGLRLREALDLSWDDPKTIHLRGVRDAWRIYFPTWSQKSRMEEEIPAPKLGDLLAGVPAERRTGKVFEIIGTHGSVIRSHHTIQKMIARAGREAGIEVHRYGDGTAKYATAHDLRRTFGSRWAEAGLDSLELMRIMRHASIETTLKFYIRFDVKRLGEKMDKVNIQWE